MKIYAFNFFLTISVISQNVSVEAAVAPCVFPQPNSSEAIGIQLEKLSNVPTINTDPYTYNLFPVEPFEEAGLQLFMDQKLGMIYSYDMETNDMTKIFDINVDELPPGIDLSWIYGVSGFTVKIQTIAQGNEGEIYMVLTSVTLPDGWTEPDSKMPDPVSREICNEDPPVFVDDIYRIGILPPCFEFGGGWLETFTVYQTFTKFSISKDGKSFSDPEPFYVVENQIAFLHNGGGMLSVPMNNGFKKLLYSTGDCTVFGFEGDKAPQVDEESCGKILFIDPQERGSSEIVAKGVRNSQQMKFFTQGDTEMVAFMDIGGATREEVNAIPLMDLVDASNINNFGWGRNQEDFKAREGTFYVNPGKGGVLVFDPPCDKQAPVPEEGFHQPWIEFDRSLPEEGFYGISGMVVSDDLQLSGKKDKKGKKDGKHTKGTEEPSDTKTGSKGKKKGIKSKKGNTLKPLTTTHELMMPFKKLKLIGTELNTGKMFGTTERFQENSEYKGPANLSLIRIFDEEGNELMKHFNSLTSELAGGVDPGRVDARPFMFLDGTAGVLIERTGVVYRMTEISL